MKKLLSILLWSVISAAFIGPGTVTTAAASGAGYGYALLWALSFSTLATVVLQEAAARVAVVSGQDLGSALRQRLAAGPGRWAVPLLVGGAVFLGCAAYEAGNILGGVAGAELALGLPGRWLTAACGLAAGLLLWLGTPRLVARLLSLAVGIMGLAFTITAVLLHPPWSEVLRGALVPRAPAAAGLLVLGLLGTTVVPYNLFLGAGLAVGERLEEMRFGLTVAVVLGGLISMAVVVVGTALSGDMTFAKLATVLGAKLGGWAAELFAWGLFAAGFSSAITAPLGATLAVRGVVAGSNDPRWAPHGVRYRAVWGSVLAIGLIFGLTGVRPIPVILVAQALNGLLLPIVALFLLVVVNDGELMGVAANRWLSNSAMGLVVGISVLLGLLQVSKAGAAALGWPLPAGRTLLWVAAGITCLAGLPIGLWIYRRRA